MKLVLKLFAPYFAVGLFWCVMGNGWLAILAYHAQILVWSCRSISRVRRPNCAWVMWVAGVTVGTGPLLYFLLPYLTHTELSSWLSDHHLDGFLFIVMIPYFGLIHPFLEQLHWAPLREKTPAAHFIFAGYHMLVLYSLVTVPWLAVCFVVLVGASFGWCIMARKSESLVAPIMSHVLADSGVVLAAWGVWELQV